MAAPGRKPPLKEQAAVAWAQILVTSELDGSLSSTAVSLGCIVSFPRADCCLADDGGVTVTLYAYTDTTSEGQQSVCENFEPAVGSETLVHGMDFIREPIPASS